METWRFRFMVIMALVILIFGDFLGYGSGSERKLHMSRQSPTMRNSQPIIFLDDEGECRRACIINVLFIFIYNSSYLEWVRGYPSLYTYVCTLFLIGLIEQKNSISPSYRMRFALELQVQPQIDRCDYKGIWTRFVGSMQVYADVDYYSKFTWNASCS